MDNADRAQIYEERERAAAVEAAKPILLRGEPGECSACGEFSPRLVRGVCCPCRDAAEKRLRQVRQ